VQSKGAEVIFYTCFSCPDLQEKWMCLHSCPHCRADLALGLVSLTQAARKKNLYQALCSASQAEILNKCSTSEEKNLAGNLRVKSVSVW